MRYLAWTGLWVGVNGLVVGAAAGHLEVMGASVALMAMAYYQLTKLV